MYGQTQTRVTLHVVINLLCDNGDDGYGVDGDGADATDVFASSSCISLSS